MGQLKQQIISGSRAISGEKPVERVTIGLPGMPHEAIIHKGKIYVYNPTGQTLIDGGIITANALIADSIITEKLALSSKQFVPNIVWTATDYNTCSWGNGTIKWADGTTSNISASNTGNITEKTYVYYNGTSALQKTTSYATAVGSNTILLAIIEPNADTDAKCIITPVFSVGATINGDKVVTGKIESVGGQTYFDLNNNIFKVSDPIRSRILIGKTGSAYGIKVSLFSVDAEVETDVNLFALWVMSDDATDNVLIKEKTRGSVEVALSDSENIAHGLSYVPFCLVFCEETSGKYVKTFGSPIDDRGVYYEIDDTNLTLYNDTGSNKTFKYYIFYDQMAA